MFDTLPDDRLLPFSIGSGAGRLIGPDGGILEVTDPVSPIFGASLAIPPGAISTNEAFSITPEPVAPPLPGGRQLLSTVRVEPGGLRFDTPASLTLPYRPEELDGQRGLGEKTLSMLHLPDGEAAWIGVPYDSVDLATKRVKGEVTSLSRYGLMYAVVEGTCTNTPYLPVLLVHGYQPPNCLYGPTGTWGNLTTLLREEAIDVFELQYSTCRGIDVIAETLSDAITKVAQCYNTELPTPRSDAAAVSVVAHSMGGLVARAAIERQDDAQQRIYALLTVATPHLGALQPSGFPFNCDDPGRPFSASFRQMAACSDFLEGSNGLNPGVRTPGEPRDLLSCRQDYEFYVGKADNVVSADSALGQTWSSGCECGEDPLIFPPPGPEATRVFKQEVGPVQSPPDCGQSQPGAGTGCGVFGNLPCEHTTDLFDCAGVGIADVRTREHVMWPKIRSFARRSRWFGAGTADPRCSTIATWTRKQPAESPIERAGHMMVYDQAREEVLVFGGRNFALQPPERDDTWIWNGETWSQRLVAGPSKRNHGGIAYDAVRGEVVLFGGQGGLFNAPRHDDTWIWDGSNWVRKQPANSPPALSGHSMAFDSVRQEVVLFGGTDSLGVDRAETWVWNGSDWTRRFPVNSPSALKWHAMAYDEARQEVVLFGGMDSGGTNRGDTWAWNGSNWTQRSSMGPAARSRPGMTYDAARGEILLFGGVELGVGEIFGDTWVWGGSGWSRVQVNNSPGRADGPGFTHDIGRDEAVLLGGIETESSLFDGTWVLRR